MKFTIGLRLFIAVLLSILGVAIIALFVMNAKVSENFSAYATKIELARLEQLGDELSMQYRVRNNWSFLPTTKLEKQEWIAQELRRIHEKHIQKNISLLPQHTPDLAVAPTIKKSQILAPPAPPAPPVPPQVLPPLPVPTPPDINRLADEDPPDVGTRTDNAESVVETNTALAVDSGDLYRRISLVDKDANYLAGLQNNPLRDTFREIYSNGELIGFLLVKESIQKPDGLTNSFIKNQGSTIGLVLLVSVILSAIAASLLALHFRTPINRLVDGARLLAEGQFSLRLDTGRTDELGELACSFNALAKKLENAEETRKQWVADTSHELRTPLSVLRAQIEAIQDGIRAATPANIALLLRQVLSLNKLIDELYALARTDIGEQVFQMKNTDVWQLINEEVDTFQEKLNFSELHIKLGTSPSQSHIYADPDRLRQVFSNLLENSIRYTQKGGCIQIEAKKIEKQMIITIDDSAPGVPTEALDRLGERFFRVDGSRTRDQGGSGLGLAMCRRIITVHGGKMTFSHAPIGGLRISIEFNLEIP